MIRVKELKALYDDYCSMSSEQIGQLLRSISIENNGGKVIGHLERSVRLLEPFNISYESLALWFSKAKQRPNFGQYVVVLTSLYEAEILEDEGVIR